MNLFQGSPAIIEIEQKIQEHQGMIKSCEEEIMRLEEQKKEEEAKLPKIKVDLDALIRALAIFKGVPPEQTEMQEPSAPPEPSTNGAKNLVPGSNTYIAREVLIGYGNPLSMPMLFAMGQKKKPELNKRSFGANVYRLAAEEKVFKVKDRKISLLEWESS